MNLYIYLASRKKEGIKVLEGFPIRTKVYPTRVEDIRSLNLTSDMASRVAEETKINKMTHELYVESADDFESLKSSLTSRGYSHLPLGQFAGLRSSGRLNERSVVTKDNTMIRRKSHLRR